jgi:hypothetical protein
MTRKTQLAGALTALLAGIALADEPIASPDDATDGATATAESDVYVYPSKGQTEKQLDRDRYECHNWAVAQSRYNPSDTHLAPHQQVRVVEMPPPGRDTAVGAMTGAVIGSTVAGHRDSGGGAVAGAIVGAMIGASSDAARQKSANQVNTRLSAEAQAERARLERQSADYRRAISACLEGRGYTVK